MDSVVEFSLLYWVRPSLLILYVFGVLDLLFSNSCLLSPSLCNYWSTFPYLNLFSSFRRGIHVALFHQTLLFLRSGNTLLTCNKRNFANMFQAHIKSRVCFVKIMVKMLNHHYIWIFKLCKCCNISSFSCSFCTINVLN